MTTVSEVLSENRGVAPREAFISRGISSYAIGRSRHSGEISRVRRAWYADPHADPELVRAVRVGGSLSCVSALRTTGVWLAPVLTTHVSVPKNASRLRSAASVRVSLIEERADVTLHWRAQTGGSLLSIDSIAASLAHMSTCQPPEMTLVALDSALNLRLVTDAQLTDAFESFPDRSRKLLSMTDPGSQSGLETLARHRLRRWGIHLRTQVVIEGIGRVDMVIGERLVLELDGFGFHAHEAAFEVDRHRDLALYERGYLVMRLSYHQVMTEWADAERVIRAMVRRGDHLWPRHRDLNRFSG